MEQKKRNRQILSITTIVSSVTLTVSQELPKYLLTMKDVLAILAVAVINQ